MKAADAPLRSWVRQYFHSASCERSVSVRAGKGSRAGPFSSFTAISETPTGAISFWMMGLLAFSISLIHPPLHTLQMRPSVKDW